MHMCTSHISALLNILMLTAHKYSILARQHTSVISLLGTWQLQQLHVQQEHFKGAWWRQPYNWGELQNAGFLRPKEIPVS